MQIVIAWYVTEQEHDGRPFAADLGAQPRMRTVRRPKAAMWLRRGTDADLARARAYCAAENARRGEGEGPLRAVVLPDDEPEPLAVARKKVA